jgi:hypothetical protein
VASTAITARQGFRLTGASSSVAPGADGVRRVLATERDRLEIRLEQAPAGATYEGYLVVNGRLRELPVGSSFDTSRGVFYWQPGLGYLGDFDFMFVRSAATGERDRIPVRVALEPRVHAPSRTGTFRSPWAGVSFLH